MLTLGLVVGTLLLRPYVFAFLALFGAAGSADLGWRRTLLFGVVLAPVAWLSEFASTRIAVPFGLYHYTGATRDRELFLANVPIMDSLSFTFLAYASFCLARAALARRAPARGTVALVAGGLMMALDVVIDPLAVRGDRWFLGQIFYYPEGGVYFGVPLSNFAGWVVVGALGVGLYLRLAGSAPGRARAGAAVLGRRIWPGVALYYVVLGFNLTVTAWIGEWTLLALGVALHTAIIATIRYVRREPAAAPALPRRGAQRA